MTSTRRSLFALVLLLTYEVATQPISVKVAKEGETWTILRSGEPYFIKGGGGSDYLGRLASYGGNSLRTWGTGEETRNLLDSAHSLGLTVCMGLWVGHQEHGFDYNNEAMVLAQLNDFQHWVETYKDHPAVLLWAIGNEVELGIAYEDLNLKVWNAINDISKMIHDIDGDHPTLTVTAGISNTKLNDIKERAPDLDLLGINCYGCVGSIPEVLQNQGWDKPYVVTEWGPNGQWESPSTSWGAVFEMTSTEKAALYFDRYADPILADGKCVGSYVFLWSSKFEATPTWYGLFFERYETQAVEEMQYHWSGQYPVDRAPRITKATLNGQQKTDNIIITQERPMEVELEVADEDTSALAYEFLIQVEEGSGGMVSDSAHSLPYIKDLLVSQDRGSATFDVPENRENFRLFYFVRDQSGNIALGNIPFRVALDPLVSNDPEILYPVKDAYIRDGDYAEVPTGKTDVENLAVRLSETIDKGFIRETLVQFDLSSIGVDTDEALLELYGGETDGVRSVAYSIGGLPWSENTITWESRYDESSYVALDTVVISSERKYHSWDVTSYVRNSLITGKAYLTFVVRNIDTYSSPTYWSSRETRPNPPRLRFRLNGKSLTLSESPNPNATGLYPNPFSDYLAVQGNALVKSIRVTDLVGSLKESLTFETGRKQVSLGHLPDGIYIVTVSTTDNNQLTRILIKKN